MTQSEILSTIERLSESVERPKGEPKVVAILTEKIISLTQLIDPTKEYNTIKPIRITGQNL